MKNHRYFWVALIGVAIFLYTSQCFANGTGTGKRILIYGPSLANNSSDEKTMAEAAGHTVVVADATTWSNATASYFAGFNAIAFGDADCNTDQSIFNAANANKNIWSPVITGPMVMYGADASLHQQPGGRALITNAINFAASTTRTGLYVSFGCYYYSSGSNFVVPYLSALGDFRVTGLGGEDSINITNPTHPVTSGLTNAALSNWGSTSHEAITTFPPTFQVIATVYMSPSWLPFIIATSGYDVCVKDNITGNLFMLNSSTGAYSYVPCGGTTPVNGQGTLMPIGNCTAIVVERTPDRIIKGVINTCTSTGTAGGNVFQGGFFIVSNLNPSGTCSCP